MSKFLKLLNSVLQEQEDLNSDKNIPSENETEGDIKPTPMDSEIQSALPEEEDVVLDVLKYQILLKALKKAIYKSYSNNLETQQEISKIKTNTDDLKILQKSENSLMSFLDNSESIPSTEE
jgi:hypothetical protein